MTNAFKIEPGGLQRNGW